MKIEYDKTVDAKYITFKQAKVAKTEPIEDWLIVDYAADESVVGIEILDASEHNLAVSAIGGDFLGYFETKSHDATIPKIDVSDERFAHYRAELVGTN